MQATLADTSQLADYLTELTQWEDAKRAEDHDRWSGLTSRQQTLKAKAPNRALSAGRSTSQRLEMLTGIFWPLAVFQRVKGAKPNPKEYAIVTMPYQGRALKGVMLDESHGRPVGTISVYSDDVRYAKKDFARETGRGGEGTTSDLRRTTSDVSKDMTQCVVTV